LSPLITILCPDLRSPSLGAAVRLRELLHPWTVEIVGPDFGGGVCSMYRQAGPFTVVPTSRLYRWPNYFWESRRIDRAVKGRLVIALKAYMNTVPVALRLQYAGKGKAVVFLDEWDGAVLAGMSGLARLRRWMGHWHLPLEDSYYPCVERCIPEASLVISTTRFLQQRFGGQVIAMGVDTGRFCPQPPESVTALKTKLGLAGFRVVVFGGVVRPHKGVEEILEAMVRTNRQDLRLLIAGPITEHVQMLRDNPRYAPLIEVAGAGMDDPAGINRAVSESLPLYLDVADFFVLPLQDTPLARSQMPIKLFEAMAMGKPIIATAVADLPRILEGCGMLVNPGDSACLSAAMVAILDDSAKAAELGRLTREKCVRDYSVAVCGARLKKMLEEVLG
jgi:glycosyltransferase involved in cell wall biosynthesis